MFRKYLCNCNLLRVEEIIAHKENFLGDIIYKIKWEGFEKGFDEWRSNYDLIGNELYSEYCEQNNIVKCEIYLYNILCILFEFDLYLDWW